MKTSSIAKLIFKDLATKISCLSETELSKIGAGTHEFTLKITKKKSTQSVSQKPSHILNEDLFSQLQKCQSREDGLTLVTDSLKNKKELEQFAKFLDVSVLKQDNVGQIRDKIIEATVGATLRSNAIQGKNITNKD